MDENDVKPNYYSIIPAPVRYDTRFGDGVRVLYSEITSLCNQTGECWAANAYFAKLYEKDERTIIRRINALVEAGYLQKKHIYDNTGRKIIGRILKPVISYFPYEIFGADDSDSMTNLSEQHDKFVGEHDNFVRTA